MITFLIKTSIKLLALSAMLYVTFFVPIGNHTLYEHLDRIADTKEAQELTSGLWETVDWVKQRVGDLALGNRAKPPSTPN